MNLSKKLVELEAVEHGSYFIVKCPICGYKEAFLYKDDLEKHKRNALFRIPIRCNRLNKCGKTSYLKEVDIDKIPVVKKDDIGISTKGIKKLNDLAYFSYCINGFDFDWRGISNSTMKVNGVIYLKEGIQSFMKKCGPGNFDDRFFKSSSYKERDLIFPIKNYNGECERLLLRSTKTLKSKKKEIGMILVQKSSEIWNRIDLIDKDKDIIFVTEGVPDGLSIKEVSQALGVVSLPGVRKYRQLVHEIKESQVSMKKTYIICFDNDDAGTTYLEKMKKQFDALSLNYLIFDLHGYKDLNEFLQEDRELFFETVKNISLKEGRK